MSIEAFCCITDLHNSESSKGQIDQDKFPAGRKSLFRCSLEDILGLLQHFPLLKKLLRAAIKGRMLWRPVVKQTWAILLYLPITYSARTHSQSFFVLRASYQLHFFCTPLHVSNFKALVPNQSMAVPKSTARAVWKNWQKYLYNGYLINCLFALQGLKRIPLWNNVA